MIVKYAIFLLIINVQLSQQRIHRLNLPDDYRTQLTLSTFGFLQGGTLEVDVKNFTYRTFKGTKSITHLADRTFGFTLDRTSTPGAASYIYLVHETKQDKCALEGLDDTDKKDDSVSVIFFRLDVARNKIIVEKYPKDAFNVSISQPQELKTVKNDSTAVGGNDTQSRNSRDAPTLVKELTMKQLPHSSNSFSFRFNMLVKNEEDEGLYNLFFHNCLNLKDDSASQINLNMKIVERNGDNYLSAGEMPEPVIFFLFGAVYFFIGVMWFSILRRSKDHVYNMHYLMLGVVWVKSCSCFLHATNQYFVEKNGHHAEAWAILFYIVYLVRGALLFITILLIGAGWAFIKHMLSDKEKKLFLIAIPLQILDNIAWIILEESEEGKAEYATYQKIFIVVDLVCCGTILFPVVWSIRHLQAASGTDNLNKLKLFRHFYILVVCYIYSTRIIVYIFKMTVPFYLVWSEEVFKEIVTIVFFVITGYKFQPADNNLYLQVPIESDEVVTESAALDTVTKVNQWKEPGGESPKPKQRESSHEYD